VIIMLRQLFIKMNNKIILKRNFGKALTSDNLKSVEKHIQTLIDRTGGVRVIDSEDYFKYRLGFLWEPEYKLLHIFVSDLTDAFKNIKKQLLKCHKDFIGLFGPMLEMAEEGEELDDDTLELFEPSIELIHKNLKPKISLVGFSGVGKTTITRLITSQEIPTEHIPTISGDIGTLKLGKLHFALWDFAGQEQFSFLWNKFIKGSDAVLLITDSSLENIEKSKFFIQMIKDEVPDAHAAVIGNKQDLPDAISIEDIQRHLPGLKAYSMIASDPANKIKMITIIADILEISGQMSPLLAPLLERDKLLDSAEKALERGDLPEAISQFEQIADLCIQLGDDKLNQVFSEKVITLRDLAAKSAPKPVPTAPVPTAPAPTAPVPAAPVPAAPVPAAPVPAPPGGGTVIPPQPQAPSAFEPSPEAKAMIQQFKIKIARVESTLADLEMDNITGSLSDADFKSKSERLLSVKSRLEKEKAALANN
jgi:small GTP-binding protein